MADDIHRNPYSMGNPYNDPRPDSHEQSFQPNYSNQPPQNRPPPMDPHAHHYDHRHMHHPQHDYSSHHGIPYPSPIQRHEPQQESGGGQTDLLEGTKITTGKAVAFAVAFSGVVATEYVKIHSLETAVEGINTELAELKKTDEKQSNQFTTELEKMDVRVKRLVVEEEQRAKANIAEIEQLIQELKAEDKLKYKEMELQIKELLGNVKALEQATTSKFNDYEKKDLQSQAELNERLSFLENKLRTLLLNAKRSGSEKED